MKYSFILEIDDISKDDINELISVLSDNKIKFHVLKSDKELKENQKYKEEKRLILKDIKEWISCAKNEKLEGDYTHKQYWDMFETILRKTINKYNTENLTDDDLKYNHYLEKENNELILENQKYKARWENLKNWIKSLPINEDNFDIIPECIYNEYGKIGITKKAILEKMIDLEEE